MTEPDAIQSLVEKYALQNAVKYEGKGNPGSVIGQILREHPEMKSEMKTLQLAAQEAVARINKLPVDEQRAKLEMLAPELLEKKEHVQRSPFESLNIPKDRPLVTGWPPEPSKYFHIGHAKACLVNYELAIWGNGEFVLRFDDTNPDLAQTEFYDIIVENLTWLGISWKRVEAGSDHMPGLYALAERLIEQGHCFVDDTPAEVVNKERYNGEPNANRHQSAKETMMRWKELKEGEVLRLKIDPGHKNSTMRDPTIFRVSDKPHCRVGTKYHKWPTYDFETCLMDAIQGITFRIRSKEFEMRTELHQYIQKLCGFPLTYYYEMARFDIEGVDTKGRVIREKIASGEYLGWDDPRLATLVALRRRGFTPEAIRSFTLSLGITKNDALLTWDDLIVHNRRVLNDRAKRLFFIDDPVEIDIHGTPKKEVHLAFFPQDKGKHDRTFHAHDTFLIARDDALALRGGELYRLMDCCNFTKDGDLYKYAGDDLDHYRKDGKRILHFIPKEHDAVKVDVLMPDASVRTGLGESRVKDLAVGDTVQFERFGFCRLDSHTNGVYKFYFAHK